MFKKNYTICLVLSLLMSTSLFAQGDWCATDQMLQEYFKNNPEAELKFKKQAYLSPKQLAEGEKANNKFVVPLAVHVIHYEGDGNISKAQIENGIRILNEDFAKMNADTSTIRSQFTGSLGDADIEFRLAKLDPNGNCTEGITRHSNLSTYSPTNRDAPKSVVQWDPYSYLNVWIVNSISSGPNSSTLGFAQFPFPAGGPPSTFGLVVRNDEWGTIGTASSSSTAGRTVTHEIGHCLNLFHPFQSGCGNNCTNSGDYVCDTPPQASSNNNSCNTNLNTCTNDATGGNSMNPNPYSSNVPDQLENFMGYGTGCQAMFTKGQVNRMRSAFTQYEKLDSLITTANLIQTGTQDNYSAPPCLPFLSMSDLKKFGCIGDTLTFTDNSWGGVIQSYNWSFPGGTPSTSTDSMPKISYAAAGSYDVVLRVSNARGTDSLVLQDFVKIATDTGYSAATYFEDFEDANKFNNDWTILKKSPRPNWEHSIFAGEGNSKNSVWINNFSADRVGDADALVSPPINLSTQPSPNINFDIAYSRKNSSSNDRLKIYISDDCGNSWNLMFNANPTYFAFDNNSRGSNFLPSSGQWKHINIPSSVIANKYRTMTNVRVMIQIENGDGNNLYIDNFSFNDTLTGINDQSNGQSINNFTVFPNPANNKAVVQVDVTDNEADASIYITDILGKRVEKIFEGEMKKSQYTFNLNLNQYESGIYFVTVRTSKGRNTQKLIVK